MKGLEEVGGVALEEEGVGFEVSKPMTSPECLSLPNQDAEL